MASAAQKLESLSSNILSGHFIFSKEYDDNSLRRQFAAPAATAHNMRFEFTKDPVLLQQYYAVRDIVYKETSGLKDYSFFEDGYDKNSEILVAMSGNVCVGGARLTISSDHSPVKLPIETNEFKVKELLASLGVHDVKYCEMSRVAVLPEFRNGAVLGQITQKMHDLCINSGVEIGFACNTQIHARRFKSVFTSLGYNMIIRDDIKVPYQKSHGKNELIFSMVDFTHSRKYHKLLQVADLIADNYDALELELEPA